MRQSDDSSAMIGDIMSDYRNKLAWVAVAFAILLWAFAPQFAWAHAIYFPPPPKVETSVLPLQNPSPPPEEPEESE